MNFFFFSSFPLSGQVKPANCHNRRFRHPSLSHTSNSAPVSFILIGSGQLNRITKDTVLPASAIFPEPRKLGGNGTGDDAGQLVCQIWIAVRPELFVGRNRADLGRNYEWRALWQRRARSGERSVTQGVRTSRGARGAFSDAAGSGEQSCFFPRKR